MIVDATLLAMAFTEPLENWWGYKKYGIICCYSAIWSYPGFQIKIEIPLISSYNILVPFSLLDLSSLFYLGDPEALHNRNLEI